MNKCLRCGKPTNNPKYCSSKCYAQMTAISTPPPRALEMYRLSLQGKTFSEIGRIHNLTRERVRQILKKYWGLNAKKLFNERFIVLHKFRCIWCKKGFYKRRDLSPRFCSKNCHSLYMHQFRHHGAIRNNFIAKGRKYPTKKYALVYVGKKDGRYRYRMKHRVVYENHIGRELKSSEIVIHKDGNGLNNHISNLELSSQSEQSKIKAAKMWEQEIPCVKLGRIFVQRKDIPKYLHPKIGT